MERIAKFVELVALLLLCASCRREEPPPQPAQGTETRPGPTTSDAPRADSKQTEETPPAASPPSPRSKTSDAPRPGSVDAPRPRSVLVSRLAGSWYPAERDRLTQQIQTFLSTARQAKHKDVHALILPHAGYRYSGQTAAYGIHQIAGGAFRRVIVLGPSHRVPLKNVASVPDATHYGTPLGEVSLDLDFLRRLRQYDFFQTIPWVHENEHSVQIQIPLLQQALDRFLLVPMVVGQLDIEHVRKMADALLGLVGEETLVVASSDFTHYGPNYGYVPFSEDVEENVRRLDMDGFAFLRGRDVDGFYRYCEEKRATFCGRYPISILLAMLPDGAEAHLLNYDTSGRITADFTNSVSYLSVAYSCRFQRAAQKNAPPADRARLESQDKENLLRVAREALKFYFEHDSLPRPEALGIEVTPAMKSISGAFVTLTEAGQLRGCIGDIYPVGPLCEVVIANAVRAAVMDRRFRPVKASELSHLELEISVLTPPRSVPSFEDIVIGKHGIVLSKQGRRAVFLPQVAPRQNWGLAETLNQLALKAGLPADAWREGARFDVFEAVVFAEGGS